MKINNHRDLWAGIMFIAVGLLFVVLSGQYTIGTAAKMGPGYFPAVLGGLLAALGLIVLRGAFAGSAEAPLRVSAIGWRETALVLLSVVLFAALLPKLGLAVALIALIGVAAIASHEFSLRDTAIAIVVLGVMSYVIFIKGLELQFPLWPAFMTK